MLSYYRVKHPGVETYRTYVKNVVMKAREADYKHALDKQEEAMSKLDNIDPSPDNLKLRKCLMKEIDYWGDKHDSIYSEAKTTASTYLP